MDDLVAVPTPISVAPARESSSGLRVGQVIDHRYQVVELLWIGVTANVYRVRHPVLGRFFALKTLRAECCSDAEWVQRLSREAKMLATLSHPNIVAVVDSGWLPTGEPYFVMEYAEGVSLGSWIREAPLEAEVAAEVAIGICDALEAAHALGIVHRDLKPENVWVDRRGGVCSVKVLDFGLAQSRGQRRLTHPSTTYGTPVYMSPEQAEGASADGRTDIYSLGVALYEMLCGRPPFDADSYLALAHQHRFAPPPPFSRWLRPDNASLRLEPVVARCLEKDAARRFESAARLREALEPFRARAETLRLTPPAARVGLRGWRSRTEAQPRAAASGGSVGARLRYSTVGWWMLVGSCLGGLISQLVR
ncbi:MAG TPA: serine/threonine-protein kinase [Polyangiaceae bacterium]|nr:serine/threonine-protein kinase [Polyangiaceae bacterium]